MEEADGLAVIMTFDAIVGPTLLLARGSAFVLPLIDSGVPLLEGCPDREFRCANVEALLTRSRGAVVLVTFFRFAEGSVVFEPL